MPRPIQPSSRRAAFTIVELMIVVAVVAVLVSILLVAFGGARRSAEQANATRFMTIIGQAIESFERELGYLPPLLMYDLDVSDQPLLGNLPPGNSRATMIIPEAKWGNSPSDMRAALARTRYGSEYSLAVYLLGTGDINGDELAGNIVGSNSAEDDGLAGPGFRDPGPDRSWGGAAGRQHQRDNQTAAKIGRTYGPFLDMAALADHIRLDARTGLFKITDNWGQPVRYYKGWPIRVAGASGALEPSIAHVPVELRTADAVEHHLESGQPDLSLEAPVLNARFMAVSAGKPIFFGLKDQPIPLFGDRRRDGAGISFTGIDGLTMPTHDPAQPFPASFNDNEETRRNLLEDLKSNLRYTP